jgi:hypothetical protein
MKRLMKSCFVPQAIARVDNRRNPHNTIMDAKVYQPPAALEQ